MKFNLIAVFFLIVCLQTLTFAKSDFEYANEAVDSGNYEKAISLYKKSANKGDLESQVELGYVYKLGELDTKIDSEESLKWFLKAAKSGDSEGQFQAASFYITKGDFKEARRWLGKAAKQDNSNAMCLLGDLYYHGQGVEKDFNKAMKIYKLAVMLKNPLASYQLGTMYYNGHGISVNYAEALRLFKQGGKRGKATLNQICNASPEFCKQYQQ